MYRLELAILEIIFDLRSVYMCICLFAYQAQWLIMAQLYKCIKIKLNSFQFNVATVWMGGQ